MANKERLSHVTPEEYLEATRRFEKEVTDAGNLEHAIQERTRKLSRSFRATMGRVGFMLAHVDRSTKTIDRYELGLTQYATATGGVAGLVVARIAYDPEHIDSAKVFDDIEIDGSNTGDELHDLYESSQAFRDFGHQGMRIIGEQAEELFEGWEDKLIPDVNYRPLFRVGAGIVLHSVYLNFEQTLAEREETARESIRKAAENAEEIEWDAELAQLLGE